MTIRSKTFFLFIAAALAVVIFIFLVQYILRLRAVSQTVVSRDLTVLKLLNGIQRVVSHAGRYEFSVEPDWQVESQGGTGVAVYPPDARSMCKVEISVLANPERRSLSTWLAGYLAEDPTAEISQISTELRIVARQPSLVWHGIMNGVASDLVYVGGGAVVYEFAPSSLVAHATSSTPCFPYLEPILNSFVIHS